MLRASYAEQSMNPIELVEQIRRMIHHITTLISSPVAIAISRNFVPLKDIAARAWSYYRLFQGLASQRDSSPRMRIALTPMTYISIASPEPFITTILNQICC